MTSTVKLAYRAAKIGLPMEFRNIRAYDMSWRRRFWLYRNGFTSSRGVMYDLNDENVDDYLDDINTQRVNLSYRKWNEADLLKNKRRFHKEFSETHPEHIPDLEGVVVNGELTDSQTGDPLDGGDLARRIQSQSLIAKPTFGVDGKHIHQIDGENDKLYLNGSEITLPELVDRITSLKDAVITEFVDQAEYAEQINPEASNTLRVLTMIDPETDEPFIAAAAHRFGTASTGYVDNWSSGGLSADVDIQTGRLGTASWSQKETGSFTRLKKHPDTGAPISGVHIPSWNDIKSGILDIAGAYGDRLKNVGWDVIVTDNEGSFKIIEGNAAPGIHLIQTHGPLLIDERIERFYRHHGVL